MLWTSQCVSGGLPSCPRDALLEDAASSEPLRMFLTEGAIGIKQVHILGLR